MRKKRVPGYIKLLTICFFAISVFFVVSTVSRYHQLQKERNNYINLVKRQAKLERERTKLENEVKQLEDEDYVVKYARDHYIFTEDGENVIVLPGKDEK